MTLTEPPPELSAPGTPPRPADARRRRRRAQLNLPHDAEGRAALVGSLARRAYPTYELFVFAALCGAILGLGYVLDSQIVLLFGILVAPLMLPWVGLLLATITGSARFFFETLMALLLAAVLVFLIGALAGLAARAFLPRTFEQAFVHSRLWWPDLVILALGAVILAVSFVRSEARPYLPSVVLAYEFFLPLAAGGFGLGSGIGDIWPHGLLVFFVHFAWASMFGLFTLMAMRILPGSVASFMFSAALAFVLLVILVILMSGGTWTPPFAPSVGQQGQPAAALDAPSSTPTLIALAQIPALETATPLIVQASDTPTLPVIIQPTATVTLTFEPTPSYAQVVAPRGGAVLRETPGGKGLTTLDNFTYVEMLPETQDLSGYTWQHVIALQNGNRREGWVAVLYLATATPDATLATPATP